MWVSPGVIGPVGITALMERGVSAAAGERLMRCRGAIGDAARRSAPVQMMRSILDADR